MKPLAVAANSLTLNLVAGDRPQSFELAATDAADGKATTFASPDAAAFEALEANSESQIRLQVTIEGVPYSAEVWHEHHDHGESHEGHTR